MTEWRRSSINVTEHRFILGLYEYEDEDGGVSLEMDIFTMEGWAHTFRGSTGSPVLKFKDFIAWMPVPEIPNDLRKKYPYF